MSVNISKLNEHLLTRSYVEGYAPSQADVHVFKALGAAPSATEAPNVARWYKHIASYSAEHGSLSGTSTAGDAFLGGAASAPVPAAAEDEDEDEVDLFGSDSEDEETKKAKEEKAAAALKAYNEKKAVKPKAAAKSIVTLEVKPWDDETNMKELEEKVRSIEKDGLLWGLSKLVPVGFGISKLQINIVIEDEKISTNDLQEEIEDFTEYVQSTDIAAMQKSRLPSGVSELATGCRRPLSVSPPETHLTLATIDPSVHTSEPSAPLELSGEATTTAADRTRYPSSSSSSAQVALAPHPVPAVSFSNARFALDEGQTVTTDRLSTSVSLRIRSRSDFEETEDSELDSAATYTSSDSSHGRVRDGSQAHHRKRPRIDPLSVDNLNPLYPSSSFVSSSLRPRLSTMRLSAEDTPLDVQSSLSISTSDSESSSHTHLRPLTPVYAKVGQDHAVRKTQNGDAPIVTNGKSSLNRVPAFLNGGHHEESNGLAERQARAVSKVPLPGTRLYEESCIDREAFIRLIVQSLREVGYVESANTLEQESGYVMETTDVSRFRKLILEGRWSEAATEVSNLIPDDAELLRAARFLISRQKYLELLEAQSINTALHVLRNELALFNDSPEDLHSLSSLIMCSNADDLRRRAEWDGINGKSRDTLLSSIQELVSPSCMLPRQRMASLVEQALLYQRTNCLYHNTPYDPQYFSLFSDHQCSKAGFPLHTTNILKSHTDEVWNIKWSCSGQYLASASRDKRVFIWRVGPDVEAGLREFALHYELEEQSEAVTCLAWSPDDLFLLTAADHSIRMWDSKTGRRLDMSDGSAHTEPVSALEWLPNGSGFLSGGFDRKIVLWTVEGAMDSVWLKISMRVTDLALAPDLSRVVVIGLESLPIATSKGPQQEGSNGNPPPTNAKEHRMMIYDFATRTQEASIRLEGELTSVKISQDSKHALVNQAPDEVQLWDLESAKMIRKFTGQRQGHHVIRSCFGGVDANFIVSGSEDGKVYVWHKNSGALLEVLPGHGTGSVNDVAWNPGNMNMFASCSDDNTIRIWESQTSIYPALSTSQAQTTSAKGKGREIAAIDMVLAPKPL